MKIKKFENIKYIEDGYYKKIDIQIQKYNADNDIIRYYVATVNDTMPFTRNSSPDLNSAIEKMKFFNNTIKDSEKPYCIFISKTKALTSDDIDLYFNSNKYNI